MNSAVDKPSQIMLRAFPLDLLKYLVIDVLAVWLIKPWPENLMRKIAIAKKKILFIKEKNKDEKNNKIITKNE